ncbi:MAG: hypothetical protein ACSHX9_01150 [Luteolibacter sp.]
MEYLGTRFGKLSPAQLAEIRFWESRQLDPSVESNQPSGAFLILTVGWLGRTQFTLKSGDGSDISYDSFDRLIPNPEGINMGVSKQLFRMSVHLGENDNLISAFADTSTIRSELTAQTGSGVLGVLDEYRTTDTSIL